MEAIVGAPTGPAEFSVQAVVMMTMQTEIAARR